MAEKNGIEKNGGGNRPVPLQLRAHHLLCLHGFRGLGYSPQFVENMWLVKNRIERDSNLLIELTDTPDAICAACPHLVGGLCHRKGSESEARLRSMDREVLNRLGFQPGHRAPCHQLVALVQQRIAPADLTSICAGCQWIELGYCRDGLRSGSLAPGTDR